MKNSIKLEELALFILGVYLFNQLDFAWWWFALLILTPDIGMVGYVVNTKVGAWMYNAFHHRGIAVLVYLAGIYLEQDLMALAGVMLFSHAAMDRIFGYGLKYPDSFQHTHLGRIGK